MMKSVSFRFARLSLLALLLSLFANAGEKLELKPGDRVCFIGNTFAERLNKAGYFEALLYAKFPDHKLTFRNLAFSCDEAVKGTLGTGAGPGTLGKFDENTYLQLRALNFGDIHTHLHEEKADVIFACYGMMESYAGAENVSKFEKDLEAFLKMHLSMNYSGKGNARVVLVSPIAHEKLEEDFPDPASHNADLKTYTESMRKVADALKIPFIDLYNTTLPVMNSPAGSKLTINGIHLNDYGTWVAAQIMMEQLGFSDVLKIEVDANGKISGNGIEGAAQKAGDKLTLNVKAAALPTALPPKSAKVQDVVLQKQPQMSIKGLQPGTYRLQAGDRLLAEADAGAWEKGVPLLGAPGADVVEKLRLMIDDKNWHFFMKYRAVNGEYIYGRRKDPFGTKSFPPEMQMIEKMCAEKDAQIQQASKPSGSFSLELIRSDRRN